MGLSVFIHFVIGYRELVSTTVGVPANRFGLVTGREFGWQRVIGFNEEMKQILLAKTFSSPDECVS